MSTEMTLSKDTLNVLKKFANIHQSISIKEGSKLAIRSADKTAFASCVVKEEFPREFNCYDLREFIQAVELIDSPVLEFDDDGLFVNIKNEKGSKQLRYIDSHIEVIKSYPEKDIKMPDTDIEVFVTHEKLNDIKKAASVLNSPYIGFKSDGENVKLISFDSNNGDDNETNSFSVDLGECKYGSEYFCFFERDSLNRLMDGDYDVKISDKGILHFSHRDLELDIYQTIDAKSKF